MFACFTKLVSLKIKLQYCHTFVGLQKALLAFKWLKDTKKAQIKYHFLNIIYPKFRVNLLSLAVQRTYVCLFKLTRVIIFNKFKSSYRPPELLCVLHNIL